MSLFTFIYIEENYSTLRGDYLPRKINFRNLRLKEQPITSLIWTLFAVIFVLAMVVNPKVVYEGALSGLSAWWNIVFPALLPFFIATEILMKLGLVKFIGVLLEPVMRPLFNVPGAGAFVLVIGFTSGYPIGSMVTAHLRQQNLCTRVEAERLMSFTNNSSPLFMLTAVSVGMFGRPELGLLIAGSHYLANILLGLTLRFYRRNDRKFVTSNSSNWSLRYAFSELMQHHRTCKLPLGQLIGESVSSSVTKLINIGGFIILFAVIIKLLTYAGIISVIASVLGLFLTPLGFPPSILTALASGGLEMTIGTKLASEAEASELQRLMAVAMILGWSGLSIHAQVASMIARTDIRMGIFVLTRIAHAVLASFFIWLFYKPVNASGTTILPALAPIVELFSYSTPMTVTYSLLAMLFMLLILLLTAFVCCAIKYLKKYIIK